MKKTITYMLALLLVISIAAAGVTRDLPRAEPGKEVAIKLIITNANPDKLFTVEEELPQSVGITDWSITGAKEAKADVKTRAVSNRYGWSFTPAASTATITYKFTAGSADLSFGTLIYFDSSGQGKVDPQTLKVFPIVCGDSVCEASETTESCSTDCPAPVTKPAEQQPAPVTAPEESEKAPTTKKPGAVATFIFMLAVVLAVIIGVIAISRGKGKKSSRFKTLIDEQ